LNHKHLFQGERHLTTGEFAFSDARGNEREIKEEGDSTLPRSGLRGERDARGPPGETCL